MIELRIHGVDGEYINELSNAGYDGLSLQDIKKASIHGSLPGLNFKIC